MKVAADPDRADARAEFLDLDEPPSGRGPLSTWTRRRTVATLAIGLAVALVATLAASLWPRHGPPLEIVGMADGPVVAWERPVTNSRQAPLLFPCGTERVALVEMAAHDLTVTCVEAADGREAWATKVPDQRSLEVRDLAGTPYLAVGSAPEVTLLDKKTGGIVARVPLPTVQNGEFPATLSSTTSGLLLITSTWAAGHASGLKVTALKGLDASESRWRVDLDTHDAGAGLQGGYRPVEERHGYLWDPDYDGSGFALALDARTGEQPAWSAAASRLVVVDDVVAAQEPGGVAGYQISSGRQLWRLEGDESLAVASDRTVILIDTPGPGASLDPAPGGLTSTVSAIDPWTGRERWRARVPLVASTAQVAGEGVLVSNLRTFDGNAALTMVALDDGAVRWSHEIDGYMGLSTALGDGYVMVDGWTMTIDPDGSAAASLNDEVLLAIDLATGEERWRLDASTPQVVGRRVVDVVDGKVVAYR